MQSCGIIEIGDTGTVGSNGRGIECAKVRWSAGGVFIAQRDSESPLHLCSDTGAQAAFNKLPHGDERDALFIENFEGHKDCICFDRQRESGGNGSHGQREQFVGHLLIDLAFEHITGETQNGFFRGQVLYSGGFCRSCRIDELETAIPVRIIVFLQNVFCCHDDFRVNLALEIRFNHRISPLALQPAHKNRVSGHTDIASL